MLDSLLTLFALQLLKIKVSSPFINMQAPIANSQLLSLSLNCRSFACKQFSISSPIPVNSIAQITFQECSFLMIAFPVTLVDWIMCLEEPTLGFEKEPYKMDEEIHWFGELPPTKIKFHTELRNIVWDFRIFYPKEKSSKAGSWIWMSK